METSRVTSRGQTTIPSKIRKSVGIKSGDITYVYSERRLRDYEKD